VHSRGLVLNHALQTCDELLVGLNRESEMIDPDDAEKEADELAKRCESAESSYILCTATLIVPANCARL